MPTRAVNSSQGLTPVTFAKARPSSDTATDAVDSVIAFSFGARCRPDEPAPPNAELAALICSRYRDLPVFAQHEIADLLPERIDAFSVQPPASGYLDTHDVALAAISAMSARGFREPVVIAHPAHLRRALAVCAKLGVVPRPPRPRVPIDFDPRSTQWWTRGPVRWWLREYPTLIYYRLRDWA